MRRLVRLHGLAAFLWGCAHGPAHWSYEGAHGPQGWGDVSATCAQGRQQSPIDLVHATHAHLPALSLSYRPMPVMLVNNGHTVQQDVPAGNSLELDGKHYQLIQFHLHHPSEHTVEGKQFPLEIHLVHKDESGSLAVIGVLVSEGLENPALEPVLKHLPKEHGGSAAPGVMLDPSALLPAHKHYFRYSGSLTTPPCTEGVQWLVMKTPVEASAEQLSRFSALFPNNARPVQPLHGRTVMVDAAP